MFGPLVAPRLYGTGSVALALPFLVLGLVQNPVADMSLANRAGTAAFLTLVFGGLLVYAAPNYAERTTERIHENPLKVFVYGITVTIPLILFIGVLLSFGFVALFGVLLLLLALFVVQLGYLALGRLVTDRWAFVLVVAAVVAVFTGGMPWVGPILGTILGSLGIGAAILDLLDDGKLWREQPDLMFGR